MAAMPFVRLTTRLAGLYGVKAFSTTPAEELEGKVILKEVNVSGKSKVV